MEGLSKTLANKLKISTLCFSRFNYGDSDFHEAPYDIDFMHKEAELLASLIKQISTRKYFYWGIVMVFYSFTCRVKNEKY